MLTTCPTARQSREGIEFGIGLRIKLDVVGIDADLIADISKFAHRVFRDEAAGLPANEIRDAPQERRSTTRGQAPYRRYLR